jgi:hypothetical protein
VNATFVSACPDAAGLSLAAVVVPALDVSLELSFPHAVLNNVAASPTPIQMRFMRSPSGDISLDIREAICLPV